MIVLSSKIIQSKGVKNGDFSISWPDGFIKSKEFLVVENYKWNFTRTE